MANELLLDTGAFVALVSSSEKSHADCVAVLMEKYQDVPMDYADATLVALGEKLETNQVFTLDRRGFSAYRLNARKSFQIVP